jgi:diaminohydroxyphosphoribosylaminopyrimidine deaminase / 5-amino-6-(5-phosphoribosylamino)uracil reductase
MVDPTPTPVALHVEQAWSLLLAARRDAHAPAMQLPALRARADQDAAQLLEIFLPLLRQGDPFVIATLGVSLDGRIATESGHSHFISSEAALIHLHRLRAFADAVVVGATTVERDDPQLTVRRCLGSSPARVVLDPRGRLDLSQRVFRDAAAPTFIVRGAASGVARGVETIGLPCNADGIAPADLLRAFAARGWRRVLIEGGGVTVSRFVGAGAIDRLHVVVAPLIIGSGRPGFTLKPIATMAQALRPRVRHFPLGDDVLFDCAFTGDD